MVLTSPWMLLGLTALPVLAAIYWFRSRTRRVVVSNLAFWADPRVPRQGGRILHRMQTPLCLFLELVAISLIVLAAAGPAVPNRDVVYPLVIVLDDSYSMQARAESQRDSDASEPLRVRDLAARAMADELRRRHYAPRFVLAGGQPRLAGEAVEQRDRMADAMKQWTCQSPTADLSAALALAAELGGPTARILVLTDHAPAADLTGGQVQWWAFGSRQPNMAFTAAARTRSAEGERVLLEVANLSNSSGNAVITLEGGDPTSAGRRSFLLAGGGATQLFLNLPPGTPALRATLAEDALEVDNRVALLPEPTKPLRVTVDLAHAPLRQAVRQALAATAATVETTERPELVVCDQSRAMTGDAWQLEILGGEEAAAYAGPFVIDRNHAIAKGLSLHNAVWSASAETTVTGLPIVMAGNVPLLTENEDAAGRRRLQMAFVAGTSNLQDMPDWPILFANLIHWRREGLPGIATPNVRLGQTVSVMLAAEVPRVQVIEPSGAQRELPLRGRHLALPAEAVGLHAIRAGDTEYAFACNTLARDESDLTQADTGRWGRWDGSAVYEQQRAGLGWFFLLVAMTVLAAHLAVVARGVRGGNA
ncbi:MAG: BatA domain-containing protein [Patescibacteria group bacterium]|nr:BatA domain-containing protein [Patescibacteria group bacterium]